MLMTVALSSFIAEHQRFVAPQKNWLMKIIDYSKDVEPSTAVKRKINDTSYYI